jgi:hypothetical protein
MPRPAHLIPLTEAHYTAIGRIATEWSALENFIGYAVRMLLGKDDRVTLAVTVNLSFLSQCDVLGALLRLRLSYNPDDVKRASKLVEDLNRDKGTQRSPRSRRNEIVHGSWVLASEPQQTFTVTYKAKGNFRPHVTPYSVDTLNDFANEIADLTGELMSQVIPLLEPSDVAATKVKHRSLRQS